MKLQKTKHPSTKPQLQSARTPDRCITFSASMLGLFAEEAARSQSFSMASRHFHESFELYFLLEGERFYFIDQDTWHVKQGMAVLIRRNQIHKTSMVGNKQYHRRFLLQIDSRQFDGFLQQLGFSDCTAFAEQYCGIAAFEPEDWQQVLACLEQLKHYLPQHNPHAMRMSMLQTLSLLFLFSHARAATETALWKEDSHSHTVDTGMYQKVHEIALYLQQHLSETPSLEQLAARFYISRSYLTRIFKTVTGFTVNEYTSFLRIKKAQFLLTETELSITEIAEQTGFGNITYFERVFKKATSMPPLQYRKHPGQHRSF